MFPIDAGETLPRTHGVGRVEGAELIVRLARILVGALGKQVGAVTAQAGKLLWVLGVFREQVFIPVVPVVHVLAVDLH